MPLNSKRTKINSENAKLSFNYEVDCSCHQICHSLVLSVLFLFYFIISLLLCGSDGLKCILFFYHYYYFFISRCFLDPLHKLSTDFVFVFHPFQSQQRLQEKYSEICLCVPPVWKPGALASIRHSTQRHTLET